MEREADLRSVPRVNFTPEQYSTVRWENIQLSLQSPQPCSSLSYMPMCLVSAHIIALHKNKLNIHQIFTLLVPDLNLLIQPPDLAITCQKLVLHTYVKEDLAFSFTYMEKSFNKHYLLDCILDSSSCVSFSDLKIVF